MIKYIIPDETVCVTVAGEHLLVSTGNSVESNSYIRQLNEHGKIIWDFMEISTAYDYVIGKMVRKFSCTEDEARAAYDSFLKLLEENGFVTKEETDD